MIYKTAIRFFSTLLFLTGLFLSCQTKTTPEEATVPTDSLLLPDPAASEINSDQSELFQTLLGTTSEGILRGINFGDPLSKVKASESFEMFEDSANHIGFTYETAQLETIDVLYYFNPEERLISKITVDVYLNSEAATRQFWQTARLEFTEKYGRPLTDKSKQLSWKKSPVRLVMEEVSDGKDYGVKLIFEPTDKTILASR
ncbi:hypothetical protein [Arundinibacter roseus]|uniref:Lipoprotein n=1 Tax=Arundinibacter roseus TaxID=2070510 RepID=A0A4R4KBN1_9BACT|nr:hypothetical protein [Arundinibacter roseus]TDB64096.1 hypothetical protein EZE20_14225 [Arundinibacter roseus]